MLYTYLHFFFLWNLTKPFEIIIPFGTGSIETTRLSYDKNGNYFDFNMNSLAPRNVYRIVFLFDNNGQKQLIDEGFKFKLV